MKRLFIVLVLINVVYLLAQAWFGAGTADKTGTAGVATASSLSTFAAPAPALPTPEAESISESVSEPVSVPDADRGVAATQPLVAQGKPKTSPRPDIRGAKKKALPGIGSPAGSCVIAGPFRRRDDGEALVRQLANAGIDGTLAKRDSTLLPDYMVYVGPKTTVAEARSLEAGFQARDMDSLLIVQGSLRNAVSLGVFSRAPLARSLLTQLQDEGFDAHIAEISRNRQGFQVQAQVPQLVRARLIAADTPMIDCPAALATAAR